MNKVKILSVIFGMTLMMMSGPLMSFQFANAQTGGETIIVFNGDYLLNEGAVQGLKATLSLPESTETPVRKASRIVALFVLRNSGLYGLPFRR